MKELPSDRPLVLWRQEGRWCAGHVDEGGALVEQGTGATPEKAEESAIRNAVEAEGFTLRCREGCDSSPAGRLVNDLLSVVGEHGFRLVRIEPDGWGPCYELLNEEGIFAVVSRINGPDVPRRAAELCRRFGTRHVT